MVASELARQPIVTNGMSSSIRFNHPKSASTRNRNAGRVANPNSKLPSRNSSKSTQLNSIKPNESFACAISTAATTKTTCKNYHKLINEPSSSSRSSSNRARQVSLLPIRTDTRRGVRQARANEAPLGLSRQLHKSSAPLLRNTSGHLAWLGSKMSRLIRWPLVHLCLPLCLTTLILITALALVISVTPIVECRGAGQYQTVVAHDPVALASLQTTTTTKHEQHPTRTNQSSAYLLPPTLTQLPGSSGGPLASAELNEQRATKEEAQTTGRTTLTTATSGATSLDPKLASKDHHRQEPARQNNNNKKNHDDEHEREIKAQNFQLAAAPHLPPMDTTIVAIARGRRSLPWATGTSVQQQQKLQHQTASSLLMPINELRVSGSKLEPPSRPSQDWSKQRPYFGPNLQRNLSVELGKTAHLVCKVFELGDKTVSWLRHGNDQVLTAGKYTFASDPRISAMNENGSTDWVLEIKDVGLNDSTSYECQVSTDPKLSQIFNLHVQAARARIKSGENNYYPVGANIEFACEILPPTSIGHQQQQQHLSRAYNSIVNNGNGGGSNSFVSDQQQIYWYHNGNLMNYAKTLADFGGTGQPARQNFSIEWDQTGQVSRLKLANIQLADSGNYTCKPTSAEPATVRLFVKKQRNSTSNRVHYSGGHHHVPNSKEAQRTRQHHEADFMESSSGSASNLLLAGTIVNFLVPLASVCLIRTILNCCRTSTNRITI